MWPYWLAQFPLKDAGLYGKLIHYIQSCFLCQQIRYFILGRLRLNKQKSGISTVPEMLIFAFVYYRCIAASIRNSGY